MRAKTRNGPSPYLTVGCAARCHRPDHYSAIAHVSWSITGVSPETVGRSSFLVDAAVRRPRLSGRRQGRRHPYTQGHHPVGARRRHGEEMRGWSLGDGLRQRPAARAGSPRLACRTSFVRARHFRHHVQWKPRLGCLARSALARLPAYQVFVFFPGRLLA
jgi:hypothetical protein